MPYFLQKLHWRLQSLPYTFCFIFFSFISKCLYLINQLLVIIIEGDQHLDELLAFWLHLEVELGPLHSVACHSRVRHSVHAEDTRHVVRVLARAVPDVQDLELWIFRLVKI